MFSGKFFEFGKRIAGVSYVSPPRHVFFGYANEQVSTLPPRPPGHEVETYEPLGLLMLLPILYRLFPQSGPASAQPSDHLESSMQAAASRQALPLSPPPTPPLSAEENIILNKTISYDVSNTYLDADALNLPERQCTLCLEPRGTGEGSGGTVGVTECGHIFCWGCLGGLEKVNWFRAEKRL